MPTGKFSSQRFRALANTNYDQSWVQFACHLSANGRPRSCAGFLLRGAAHNLAVRLALADGKIDPALLRETVPLYDTYREMAIANGVDEDDPALRGCRDDAQIEVGR